MLFCLCLPLEHAGANGWEHTSIDFDVLVTALSDDNPEIRRRAAESIGFRRQPGATVALLKRLGYTEPVARVRAEIYASLGRLGDSDGLDALADCLDSESETAVRVQCAGALGYIDAPQAAPLALAALDDEAHGVKLAALASLGSFADPAVAKKLIELSSASDPRFAETALISLGRTRAAEATPILLDHLSRKQTHRRTLAALRALTLHADPATAEAVETFYRQNDDIELRQHALVAMANIRSRGSEALFLDALDSDDFTSQRLGLAILRNFGGAAQAPAVARRALAIANGIYGRPADELTEDPVQTISRLELLLAYLKTIVKLDPAAGEAVFLRAAAAVALPRTNSAELKIAQGFYRLRWQSLYGLGYAGSRDARRLIEAALEDPDARIRAVATRSMGVIGAVDAAASLEPLLRDRAAEVRWMAARVLGRLGATASGNRLIESLDDAHAQVRVEAALALGYLKARSALPKLDSLARGDESPRVSEAAAFAASLTRGLSSPRASESRLGSAERAFR